MERLEGRRRLVAAAYFGLVCIFFLSGCALTKDYVTIDYTPEQNMEKVNGADNITVQVAVTDVRNIRDKVSCKKNGYGMEMADIISNNDVVKVLTGAIETELRNRGFKINGGDIIVGIELVKFYNDFKSGFFSGDATADVAIGVQVKKPDGNINFAKSVTGTFTEKGIQLASGKNAKAALDGALQDAVSKLVKDHAFITALLQAKK